MSVCKQCKKSCSEHELSTTQSLCKACRQMFPSVLCKYCRVEFRAKNGTDKRNVACVECQMNVQLYGQPAKCIYCLLPSAFGSQPCRRCESSKKKYGNPVKCEMCDKQSAFIKEADRRQKVGGKILCMLCTMEYKRKLHREKKRPMKDKEKHNSESTRIKHGTDNDSTDVDSRASESTTTDRVPVSLESVLQADSVLRVSQLNEEVADLKRAVQQKDQEIFKKDKLIFELKAQLNQTEKSYRQKIVTLQKESKEKSEALLSQRRALQRQPGKKKTST
ncbi:protein FAM76A-like [Oscarella lobularis]|uniref:protein FAM76A-like n=1 Tax=Oscarella lobularis TaxID=121494 RepID=UPI003313E313